MMVQGRNTQQTAATVSNEFVSKQKPDAPAANFPKAEAQENPVVQVNISAAGRKLSQTEKSAGPADAQLNELKVEEDERQRKLQYMHSLEERLKDENLSTEDRKLLETDVASLKKETMTNREKIAELKSEMIEREKKSDESGTFFNPIGYLIQIRNLTALQKQKDEELRVLEPQAHQENANLAAAEMKAAEADATPKETERQADDFAAAFADKESLQHLSDLLEAQNAAHANDDAETKEENAVVADDASASSGENVEEARKR